jgi:DNA-binding CsgD family transcriptional regulator/tetratricopeptide (TPR) repeat protein
VSLVERDDQLGRLRAVVENAWSGSGGRVVAVSGEPGAGKSSLLRAALEDVPAYWGWCEPGLTPRPLGPFRDVVRAGALESAPGTQDLAEALLDAMRQPLVVVVEDGHWIDEASARALRFIGRRIERTSGVVLVSYRDGIASDSMLRVVLADLAMSDSLERVEVGPLSVEGVAQLVAGTGRDAAEVHRVTGGNAFLVAALRDAPDEDLGAGVRDLSWSWARRLDADALALVKELAVVPGRIPLDSLWQRATGLDPLVLGGLLRIDGDHVEFRLELVRRALDAELTPDERLRAHAAAYQRLIVRPDAEPSELAFHARHGGLSAETLEHERAAADRAVDSGAHLQAVNHLRRVVDLADGRLEPEEVVRLCIALCEQEYLVGHDADARRYAAKALALAERDGDRLLRGRALMARSRVSASEQEVFEFADRALSVFETVGGPDLADACAHMASRRMVARDLEVAAGWAQRALSLIDPDEHPAIAVNALQALGSALTLTGRDDNCVHLRRAVELGARADVDTMTGLAHANLVSAAGEARLYAVVGQARGAALDFFERHDLDALAGYTRAWLGRCDLEQGRWDEALRQAEEVIAGRERSSEISMITALTVQGRVLARRGSDGAVQALDAAWERAEATGSLQRMGPVAVARAELAWLAGEDHDTAGLDAARALAHEPHHVAYAAELELWSRRSGRPAAEVSGAPQPWASWLAEDHLAAGEAWLALGCPYEAADAFGGAGDEDVLRRALGLIDDLGAAPLRARVVRRMRETGVRSIPRGPRRTTTQDVWGLTAREQEVLGWLRQGSTDAEIATALHLSVKTVGHHVSAVLRKTGSTSRRDLRAPSP